MAHAIKKDAYNNSKEINVNDLVVYDVAALSERGIDADNDDDEVYAVISITKGGGKGKVKYDQAELVTVYSEFQSELFEKRTIEVRDLKLYNGIITLSNDKIQ